MSKPILLVVFQSRFTNFHYKLLELEHYKPEFEVVVLDLSILISSISQKLNSTEGSSFNEVITPKKWTNLLDILFGLRQKLINQIEKSSISIYGVTSHSLKSFIFHCLFLIILKRYFFAVIRLWNGGILITERSTNIGYKNSFIVKILEKFRKITNFKELIIYATSKFYDILSKLFPLAHTHVLVAGTDWENSLKFSGFLRKNIKVIFGHSFDYSACLLNTTFTQTMKEIDPKSIVYLDTGSPKFLGDSLSSGRKVFYTSEKWYPSLCRFFDFVEESRCGPIFIAAHYKAPHSPNPYYFGFRKVFFNTLALIENSKEVLSVGSTATSMAVYCNKPIVFLTSNQQNKDESFVEYLTDLSSSLGMPIANIDDSFLNWPNSAAFIDPVRYKNYSSRCLSSNKTKDPNFMIIRKLTKKSIL